MTLEKLEQLSDEDLNRKAHELIGLGCWHVWEFIPYKKFIKIGTCKFCKSKDKEEFERTMPNYCQDFNDAFKKEYHNDKINQQTTQNINIVSRRQRTNYM